MVLVKYQLANSNLGFFDLSVLDLKSGIDEPILQTPMERTKNPNTIVRSKPKVSVAENR